MELSGLRNAIEIRLAAAINDYFALLEQAPPKGLLSNLRQNLRLATARLRLKNDLQAIIRDGHQSAAAIANGERPLTGDQMRIVNSRIRDSDRYLNAYLKALPEMNRLMAVARIVSYSAAIIQTASAVSSQGKPTLPVYPGDRSLACNGFCHCHLEWVRLPGGFDVRWVLDPEAEHCVDCQALAVRWNPLRIRNGQIQDKAVKAIQAEYLLRKAASL